MGTRGYTLAVTVLIMKKFGWILGIAAVLATASAIAMNTREIIAERRVVSATNEAKIAYVHKDWPEAEKNYRQVLDREPHNAEAQFMLGFSIHYQGRYDEARTLFQQAEGMGYRPELCQYNIACGYARSGDRVRALEHLRKSVERGFNMVDWASEDPDLASLHDDPEFKQIIDSARRRQSRHGIPRFFPA